MSLLEELQYRLFVFHRWIRELKFRILKVDRSFYCQAEIEGRHQCKYQCDHCREYYKPLEDNWKKQ
jgi:nuclear transport factor 2 (NTF2) superfamily protein